MADWAFVTQSECALFRVHVGRGDVGDVLVASIPGDPIPDTRPALIKRKNYSVCVRGTIRYTPVNLPSDLAFVNGPLGSESPFGGQNMADDEWSCEMLDSGTVYCCLTCKHGKELDYIQIQTNTVHTLPSETWAVPMGGPATINGFAIPEFGIAHKVSGDMDIQTADLVVCCTTR